MSDAAHIFYRPPAIKVKIDSWRDSEKNLIAGHVFFHRYVWVGPYVHPGVVHQQSNTKEALVAPFRVNKTLHK
jgi:hypothetical protein